MRKSVAAVAGQKFVEEADFVWSQRFELAPDVFTPGTSDVGWLLEVAGIPDDLSGKTVLDIGTANGGACWEVERRGAARVVGVDIYPAEWFGFAQLKRLLNSEAEFVQASVYDLPAVLDEEFDVVLFLGVLYHLRHPLLALDSLRGLVKGEALIETAVADHELGSHAAAPLARFYRHDELGGDPSNWFAPTITGLLDWCGSCGLDAEVLGAWPSEAPERCMVRAARSAGDPEYVQLSYERPLILQGRAPTL